MNSIGPVIAKYRKLNHMSQPDLSLELEKFGIEVSQKAISAWESSRNEPGVKQLFALCQIFGIRDIYEEIYGINPYNPLSKLNDLGKERALEYIDMLAKENKFAKAVDNTIQITPTRIVNLYSIGVSAGTGNFLDSDDYVEIEVDKFVPSGTDYAVHVSGDSMMPMYHDEQIIYIHKQDTLEDGEIGIFCLNGNAYCKKLQRNKKRTALISLNRKYKPIPITESDELIVLGRVLG